MGYRRSRSQNAHSSRPINATMTASAAMTMTQTPPTFNAATDRASTP